MKEKTKMAKFLNTNEIFLSENCLEKTAGDQEEGTMPY